MRGVSKSKYRRQLERWMYRTTIRQHAKVIRSAQERLEFAMDAEARAEKMLAWAAALGAVAVSACVLAALLVAP